MENLQFLNAFSFLAPQAEQFLPEHYDGLEYRWKSFVFRPALFQVEGVLLGLVVLYFALAMVGTTWNAKKAANWAKAHTALYASQFAFPGLPKNLVSDGPSDFIVYSTGRRAISSLHTIFSLIPRQDVAQLAVVFGRSLIDLEYSPSDDVQLDFTLQPSTETPTPGFVWAVVAKTEMNALRKERWDLTFTRTAENSALPVTCSIMAESGDIGTLILQSAPGQAICELLKNPNVNRHFRSLLITDSPDKRPTAGPIPADKKERHVILSLHLPSGSRVGETEPLVKAVFDLIDWLDNKPNIRADIAKKLLKFRTDLDAELLKEANEPTQEEKEEAEEAKRTAKRKAEEEKFNSLTPDQQRKFEEQERKKAQRKAQAKMVRKR